MESWENFHQAVQYLIGPGSIQERLEKALWGGLPEQKPEDLPEGLQSNYSEILEKLYEDLPIRDPGYWPAKIQKMNLEEAHEIAERILYIYTELSKQL
jgi:hypothetical protein